MQQSELLHHLAVIAHLGIRGCEMAVPKKGELFFERTLGAEHALGPPLTGSVHLHHIRP
jgi:hypothetical protein